MTCFFLRGNISARLLHCVSVSLYWPLWASAVSVCSGEADRKRTKGLQCANSHTASPVIPNSVRHVASPQTPLT